MTDMVTVFRAVFNLNPDAKFRIFNEDISTIVWRPDHTGVTPSHQEIQEEYDRLISGKAQEELEARRIAEYRSQSDPLFFKWQAGECTKQEWLDKRAEIKASIT